MQVRIRCPHWFLLLQLAVTCACLAAAEAEQQPLEAATSAKTASVSVPFFAVLERLARLVDISYCIGSSGVHKPFDCLSRCKDFPSVDLVRTWNTGVLLSDSCGYIAVDHDDRAIRKLEDDGDTASDSGSIIVAFRGTYSISNTVVDLSTIPQKYVPYPSPDDGGDEPPEDPKHRCDNCTVHMGFLSSWQNARELVLPELKELKAKYPTYPVQLVGHSLGGAVACLAALELKVSLGWDDVTVTTFGEPRVGNHHLASYVDEAFDLHADVPPESLRYRRLTHNDDPVPLLPLGEWGYRSHAGEIYISKKSLSPGETDLQFCAGDDDPECSAGADSTLRETMRHLLHFVGLGAGSEFEKDSVEARSGFPTRFKLWELFFAHRDYFWRLGLCVPGGDPADWWREKFGRWYSEEL